MFVNDSADEELDCRLGHEQGVGREYAADGAVGHASEQAHARAVLAPGIQILEGLCTRYNGRNQDCLRYNPYDELPSTEKGKKLVEIVCRLSNGSKDGNKDSAATNEDGPSQRPPGEGLPKYQRGTD